MTADGYVQNEGDIGVKGPPYRIAYGSLVPKKSECTNLLVPVAVSSSHIAFGSIRMEPVFMILGQSAATAAAMSLDRNVAVQDLEYQQLRERLIADGQVLDYAGRKYGPVVRIDAESLDGIVIDDVQAAKSGTWHPSAATGGFLGGGYLHDNNEAKGEKHVRFETKIDKAGRYEIRLAYTADSNRATNVPVTVQSGDAKRTATINQKKQPEIDNIFVSVGTISAKAGDRITVTISNRATEGYVIVDGVQFLPLE